MRMKKDLDGMQLKGDVGFTKSGVFSSGSKNMRCDLDLINPGS